MTFIIEQRTQSLRAEQTRSTVRRAVLLLLFISSVLVLCSIFICGTALQLPS
jgi:hypothetical protein